MKKNNLTKNTLLLSLATILNKGLMFIMVPFFSKWLTLGDYGTFDLLCTYITILIPLLTLSTGEAVFRFSIDESEKSLKAKYVTNGLVILLLGSSVLFIGALVVYKLANWSLIIPFVVLAINEIFNKYLQSYLRGIRKLNIYSICSSISTIVIAVSVTILVRIFNKGLVGMIYGYSLGYFFSNIIIIVSTKYWEYLCTDISVNEIIKMIKYSCVLIPNSISWWVMNVSDRLLIKLFLGLDYNGIYSIACKVPSLCSSIFGVFSISWQESASDIINSENRDKYFTNVYNKMLKILIPLCSVILSLNFILFDYIFDSKYSDARYYTPILITAAIFMSISQFYGGIQISLKKPKENGKSTMIGALANILINFGLIKFIGLYAATISTAISFMIVTYLRRNKLKNSINISLEKNSKSYIVFYLYLILISYLNKNFVINIINLILSIVFFMFFNKELITSILKGIFNKVRAK